MVECNVFHLARSVVAVTQAVTGVEGDTGYAPGVVIGVALVLVAGDLAEGIVIIACHDAVFGDPA